MLLLALCFAYIAFCKASTTEDPAAEDGTTDDGDGDGNGEDSGAALMANAILISLGIIASRFY